MKRLLVLLVALGALPEVMLATPEQAHAATPCWKSLLNDWYDGRIDGTYPAPLLPRGDRVACRTT